MFRGTMRVVVLQAETGRLLVLSPTSKLVPGQLDGTGTAVETRTREFLGTSALVDPVRDLARVSAEPAH